MLTISVKNDHFCTGMTKIIITLKIMGLTEEPKKLQQKKNLLFFIILILITINSDRSHMRY